MDGWEVQGDGAIDYFWAARKGPVYATKWEDDTIMHITSPLPQ